MAGTGRKLTTLPLKRKIELIEAVESGEKTQTEARRRGIQQKAIDYRRTEDNSKKAIIFESTFKPL